MGVSRRNRVLAFIAGGVLLTFALLIGWFWWSSQLPPLTLPVRTPPKPNAFDTLALAHKKLVKKVGTASLQGTYVSAKGSAKAYTDFGKLMDRAALVRENEEAVRLIRLALTQEYLAPINFRIDQLLPHYANHKELCRALIMAARLAFGAKQWKVGATYCCDAIQLGQLISTNEYLMGRLVGLACESLSLPLLSEYADGLPLDVIATTYERLSAIESRRDPLSVSLENERIGYQVLIRAIANQTPKEISQMIGINDEQAWMIMLASKRSASVSGDEYFAETMRIARQPYDKRTAHVSPPGGPICDAALMDMSYAFFRETLRCTERTLLLANLWTRLNGHSAELPSHYIDPFGKGKPLRTVKSGSKFTIYSVGPDGVDDSGAKLSNAGSKSPQPRESSTGDMTWPVARPVDSYDY